MRDSYSVGVEKSNEEHKVLIEIINEIFTIVRKHESLGYLSLTVNKFIQCSQEHFSDEEAMLEAINYPELAEHKLIHAKFLHDVTAYKKRIDDNDKEAVLGFYHFVRDWLPTHILEVDMQYKPFFEESKDMEF